MRMQQQGSTGHTGCVTREGMQHTQQNSEAQVNICLS